MSDRIDPRVEDRAVDHGADDVPEYTAGFWIGLVVGVVLIAYGLRGVFVDLPGFRLTSYARWFLGGALIHDLVVAPVVCVLGWFLARRLPRPAIAPVQIALLVSGVVALVSWPLVRGYGITPGEPSFLSRNYTASVLTVWAVVWVGALAAIAVRVVIARRR